MITPKAREAFLQELSQLTIKHGIVIGGCGCCGSPWMDEDRVSFKGSYSSEADEYIEWEEP
jgi:hypothetical protein